MSLYAEFVKEYEDFDTIEYPGVAFACYKITGDECYIKNIFISKAHRSQKISYQIQEDITKVAKAAGCTYLLGTVSPFSKTASFSMAGLLKDGFKFHRYDDSMMYFVKYFKE